jgi:hypothetical protein
MLYSFFCVIPRRLNFMCRCFETPCMFTRRLKACGTDCSETSGQKIKKPDNNPKERIQQLKYV